MTKEKKLTEQEVMNLKKDQLHMVSGGAEASQKKKTRICPNCGRELPADQKSCCCGW